MYNSNTEVHMEKNFTPVQTVQLGRIRIQENLEKMIAEALDMKKDGLGTTLIGEALDKFGRTTADDAFSQDSDHMKGHAWLENAVTSSEKRIAYMIKGALDANPKYLSVVKEVYRDCAYTLGYQIKSKNTITGLEEAYAALDSVVLDGMPCDKVNQIESVTADTLVWSGSKDVHRENFEAAGLSSDIFPSLRETFNRELLKALGNFSYSLEIRETEPIFLNKITK